MFQQLVRILIAIVTQFFLECGTDAIDICIEQFHDMKHIDADSDIWETSFSECDKPTMHVAGKETDFLALWQVEGKEVGCEFIQSNCGKNIDDAAGVTIANITMKFIYDPSFFEES